MVFSSPILPSTTNWRDRVVKKGFSMDDIPFDKVVEIYKKMRQLEWERAYSIQTD